MAPRDAGGWAEKGELTLVELIVNGVLFFVFVFLLENLFPF